MFVSVDVTGKVVQNVLEDYKIYMRAMDNVLSEPAALPLQQVIAPRMSSKMHPMDFEDDNATLVAAGSSEGVVVWLTPEKKKIELRNWAKP